MIPQEKKMERYEIIKISKKNIESMALEKAKTELEKNYIVSTGQYDPLELKKAINQKKPVVIDGHFLIGYDAGPNGKFIDSKEEKISISKMTKAIIIEEEKTPSDPIEKEEKDLGDPFAILGKNEWEEIPDFFTVFGNLKVGEVFLPPHSAIFNFLNPTDEQKKKKIVSMLAGVNINVYGRDNYIDNCIHEIGHLFWRDCLTFKEKRSFENLFKILRPSAIYEYEWERVSPEEVFCTIYKWFVKSMLLNKSFYNILEFEEPQGLALLQNIFTRVSHDRQVQGIWNLSQKEIIEYLNPKFDLVSGRYLRKAGLLEKIRDIELPASVLDNIEYRENGIEFIRLEKALVPVKNKKIMWNAILEKEKW